MCQDEEVTLTIMGCICSVLEVNIGDIMDFVHVEGDAQ